VVDLGSAAPEWVQGHGHDVLVHPMKLRENFLIETKM